ncbi:hypothetical protein HY008_03185, partial [Candidatus Woesebacteria bacterium]|nr:hypothetical protein [Candidatus Woesebacteria bacterium]
GFGYRALLPGQSLWSAARNASYALMTIVVLILAFMIMFRYRISPQVVISVQSALPKIAIALVLITFSYAVAGFMVDLAYLTEAIIAALLTSTGAGISTLDPPRIFELMNSFVTGISAFGYLVFLVVFTNSAALLLSPALGAVFGLNILVALIVVVILAIAILRIFWVLLKTYVTVLLLVIAAPFYILGGALNLGGGILGWLRNLVAQLSVFVMVGILILFAHVFVWSTAYSGSAIANAGNGCLTIPIVGQVCIPSLGIATNPYRIILPTWSPSDPARVGAGALPNFGGMDISLIGFFVAFATILAAPSMASAVRNYLLGMRQEGLGPAIGAGIGPIITTPAGFASHRLGQSIYAEEQAAKLQQRGADVRTLQSLRALAERLTRLRF